MNEEQNENVSYFVLEGIMTHFSVMYKRLFLLCVAILVVFSIIIGGLLWYISLPVEETESVTVENQDGNANYIGNDMNGDFNYGESH